MGTGGLHSQDIPMEIWSTSDYGCHGVIPCPSPTGELQKAELFTLVHWDINREIVPHKYPFNCWKLAKLIVLQHKMKI